MSRYQENQVPPTLEARVQMFMDLSQEYFEIVPRLESFQIMLIGDSNIVRFHKRVISLHLSLIRKFINEDDQVYLGAINQQLYEEYGRNLPRSVRKALRAQQHDYAKLNQTLFSDETFRIIGTDGEEVDQAQALYNLMYGRILHDDYGKWCSASNWHSAYHQAATSLSNARDILRFSRSTFLYLHNRGFFPDLKFAETLSEDLYNGRGEYLGRKELKHYEIRVPEWTEGNA